MRLLTLDWMIGLWRVWFLERVCLIKAKQLKLHAAPFNKFSINITYILVFYINNFFTIDNFKRHLQQTPLLQCKGLWVLKSNRMSSLCTLDLLFLTYYDSGHTNPNLLY